MKKPPQREADTQRTIAAYLTLHRFLWWRNNAGGTKAGKSWIALGLVGSPDIYVLRSGILYGIEVKSEPNVQGPKQIEFEAKLKSAGGRYILAYSLEDVLEGLK